MRARQPAANVCGKCSRRCGWKALPNQAAPAFRRTTAARGAGAGAGRAARILLLDEPFAALDKNLRLDMQIEIKRLQRQFGLTAILVTHDQDEAMSIADRIAVMSKGKIEQLGSPVEIYDAPETLFVNDFIGSSNRFAGTVEAMEGQTYSVRLAGGALWQVASRKSFTKAIRWS